jgi:hypothetical protein
MILKEKRGKKTIKVGTKIKNRKKTVNITMMILQQ